LLDFFSVAFSLFSVVFTSGVWAAFSKGVFFFGTPSKRSSTCFSIFSVETEILLSCSFAVICGVFLVGHYFCFFREYYSKEYIRKYQLNTRKNLIFRNRMTLGKRVLERGFFRKKNKRIIFIKK
jgi:hypothetical protein